MRSQVASPETYPSKDLYSVLTPIHRATTDVHTIPTPKEEENILGIERWINSKDLKKTLQVFRAVNHQLRKTIMNLLDVHGSRTVTQIYVSMRLDQSVVSQHLSILRKAGVVKTEKVGKFIYYSLNENKLSHLSDLLSNINSCN